MYIKRNRFGIPLAASAVLSVAAILQSSMAYGQDVSKSFQIEAPVVDLLKGNLDVGELEGDTVLRIFEQVSNQKQPVPVQPFLGKRDIESPVELLLDAGKTNSPEQDKENPSLTNIGKDAAKLPVENRAVSKALIEMPTKQLVDLGRSAKNDPLEFEDLLFAGSSKKSENPSVEPGLVDWHADLKTAALQSKTSGKPVLHFQLLGQLDQRFT